MTPTILFDLDGTLVDTAPDLAAALARLMAARGLAGFDIATTRAMLGDGVAVLVERAFAARGRQPDAAAVHHFIADYTRNVAVESVPFPGVAPALSDALQRGWRLAVCTNKPEAAARRLLDALGLAEAFAAIGGGDSFPVRKPDPGHIRATLALAGGTPEAALMVGDHANDIAAATGAAIPCIFAAWGYGGPAMATGATATAAAPGEAIAIAARLLDAAPPGQTR